MTKSDENSIVEGVNWILKNKEVIKNHEAEMEKIKFVIAKLTQESIDVGNDLKGDMGKQTSMNMLIGGKYYTVTQHGVGVQIFVLQMDILA